MVAEGVVGSQNLFAGAPRSYGRENAGELFAQYFWFHTCSNLSVRLNLETASVMPEHGRFPG